MRTRIPSYRILFAALTASLPVPAAEVALEAWVQRHGSNVAQAAAVALAVDASGNVMVTGSSEGDYFTAKYAAADGTLLWEKRYNGLANGEDFATAIAVDAAGDVVVTGSSHNGRDWDYYTAKYAAANGALLWEQRYDGPAHGDDHPAALGLDSYGNVVVTGSFTGIGTGWDSYTAKYAAADGALRWEQRYYDPGNREDQAKALAIDASGNVVVTGHYFTAKYGANGALLWERRYNESRDRNQTLAVDANGDVVVKGAWYTQKYGGEDGALLWESQDNKGGVAVVVDANGNVVVAGHSIQYTRGPGIPSGFPGYEPVNYYYIAKYAAADGALLWESQDSKGGVAVVVDANGNVVVAGRSVSTNGAATTTDFYTAKYAAENGALLWEKRYNSPTNGDDIASAVVLGPDGSIVVTGASAGDLATVKYITITYPTAVVLSLTVMPEGARLRFTGDAGRAYRLQRASNPAGPWSTLAALTAPPDGVIEHLEPAPRSPSAFYRVTAP